jgi:ribosomal protein S18 acetylase RimI-like enzyme
MNELIAVARSRGVERLVLNSSPERKPAHKLYRKLGFVKAKTNVFKKVL